VDKSFSSCFGKSFFWFLPFLVCCVFSRVCLGGGGRKLFACVLCASSLAWATVEAREDGWKSVPGHFVLPMSWQCVANVLLLCC